MDDLLTSLPGDIPGLLRRGSPVLWTEAMIPGVVVALVAEELGSYSDPPILSVALFGHHVLPDRCIDVYAHDRRHLVLDLTDPTGRAHAAWWADERAPGTSAHEQRGSSLFMSIPERTAVARAQQCHPMTPEQIDTLARLVLRLAGRS